MLPISKQAARQSMGVSTMLKVIAPEMLLLLFTVFYFLVPTVLWGETFLISHPLKTTLAFVVLFGIFESIVVSHVWGACKEVQIRSTCNESETKAPPGSLLNGVAIFLCVFFFSHVLCVLFGAPLIENAEKTAVWALLATSLVAVPNLCVFGPVFHPWHRVIVCGEFLDPTERFLYIQALGVALGTWMSAVVIPLDWDRDWQVWPIPCIIGCLIGNTVALLVNCIVSLRELKTTKIH